MRTQPGPDVGQVALAANAPMLIKATMVDGRPEVGVLPTGQVTGVSTSCRRWPSCSARIVGRGASRPLEAPGDAADRGPDLVGRARKRVPGRGPATWLARNRAGRWRGAERPGGSDPCPRATPARASPSTSSGSGGCSTPAGRWCRGRAEYGGRGASLWEWLMFEEEYYRAGGPPAGHPERHLPAGADASSSSARRSSRTRILPRMAAAEDLWCQGWSEPDAGSDLASLTSQARTGRRRLGARRPEDVDHPGRVLHPPVRPVPHRPRQRAAPGPDLPARARSTRPGVTVRGFGRLDGDEGFAEVFFDDAFVADDAVPGGVVLGEVGAGLEGGDGHHRLGAGPDAAVAGPLPGHRRAPAACEPLPGDDRRRRSAPSGLRDDGRRALDGRPRRYRARTTLQHRRPRTRLGGHCGRSGAGCGRASTKMLAGPSCDVDACTRPACALGRARRGPRVRRALAEAGRGAVEQGLAVLAVRADLRRHQRDPAQHHRRAPARPAEGLTVRFALTDDQLAFARRRARPAGQAVLARGGAGRVAEAPARPAGRRRPRVGRAGRHGRAGPDRPRGGRRAGPRRVSTWRRSWRRPAAPRCRTPWSTPRPSPRPLGVPEARRGRRRHRPGRADRGRARRTPTSSSCSTGRPAACTRCRPRRGRPHRRSPPSTPPAAPPGSPGRPQTAGWSPTTRPPSGGPSTGACSAPPPSCSAWPPRCST